MASMVTTGGILADIGTDHAYVPIALVQRQKIKGALQWILMRDRLPGHRNISGQPGWRNIYRPGFGRSRGTASK
mgnify:CR=1 FL=1